MKSLLLAFLFSTTAVPVWAADMPVKAPRSAELIINDWSGIYVGVGAGAGWGTEKLDTSVTGVNNLFGTSATSIFTNQSTIIQPNFTSPGLPEIASLKQNGFMIGGFAGAQKQLGNWVLGLEVSFDATGMKKSLAGESTDREDVIRFVPNTTFSTVPVTVTVPGQTAPVTDGKFVIPDQKVTVNGQELTVKGTTVTISGQVATIIPAIVINGHVIVPAVTVPVSNGSFVIPDQKVTVNGQEVTVKGTTVVISGQTAAVAPKDITIPGQPITIGLPAPTTRAADVTRTVNIETKIDEIFDARGKIGITNIISPDVLLYATGGAAIAHMTKTVDITQTTTLVGTPAGSRTNVFSASQGETRLGWVAGAGIDWKMTPNLVLGVLYRHHEFPKGTVSFSDGANSVGFGSSTQKVDSVQGRLSVMFPVH